jgi:hypothetical protein
MLSRQSSPRRQTERAGNARAHHLGGPVILAPTGVVASPFVTHLQYRIVK